MPRNTRSGQNGGETGSETGSDAENDNVIAHPEPMSSSQLEHEMMKRISSLESLIKRQAIQPPQTPYNDTLLGGQIGSLSAQRTDNGRSADVFGGVGPHPRERDDTVTSSAEVTLLASSSALRKQVFELNEIYTQMDSCRERAETLGQQEAKLMFEQGNETEGNATSMRSLDSTPVPSAADVLHGETVTDDLTSVGSSQDKLKKVQGMLESVAKYNTTLRQRLRTYLEVTFGLHTTYKEEYQMHTTRVKIEIPEGLGAKPSIYAAQLFRVSLDKHVSNFPIQCAPLIPFLYESLGRNSKKNTEGSIGRGETVSQIRWTPPCTTDPKYLETSPFKSFNQRYNRANKLLYQVMSHQNYARTRTYLGLRSNGSHGKMRTLTHGRVDDAMSIICSIVFFHESSSFTDLLILKQQCAGAYALFATQPVEQAIKNARKMLDHAVVLDLKLPWQTISLTIGILIQKNPLFASYLSPWMEPREGSDPDDCLEQILLFLSTVEHVQQKIKMSITDVRKRSHLNVYYNNNNTGLFDMSNYGRETKKSIPQNRRTDTKPRKPIPRKGGPRGKPPNKTQYAKGPQKGSNWTRNNDTSRGRAGPWKATAKATYNSKGGNAKQPQITYPQKKPSFQRGKQPFSLRDRQTAMHTGSALSPKGSSVRQTKTIKPKKAVTWKTNEVTAMITQAVQDALHETRGKPEPGGVTNYWRNEMGAQNVACMMNRNHNKPNPRVAKTVKRKDSKKQHKREPSAHAEEHERMTRARSLAKRELQQTRRQERSLKARAVSNQQCNGIVDNSIRLPGQPGNHTSQANNGIVLDIEDTMGGSKDYLPQHFKEVRRSARNNHVPQKNIMGSQWQAGVTI